MPVAEYHARVGPDGTLDLHLSLGLEQANHDVTVIVKSTEDKPARAASQEEWERIIRETAGSIDDPTFVRPEQGEFERRDDPFP